MLHFVDVSLDAWLVVKASTLLVGLLLMCYKLKLETFKINFAVNLTCDIKVDKNMFFILFQKTRLLRSKLLKEYVQVCTL